MGRKSAFPWGCSSSPIPGVFWLLGLQGLWEGTVGGHLQSSPCPHPDMMGVSKECLPPRGTPLAGAETPPGSVSRHSKRVYLPMCQNKGQKSSIYLCSINRSAFLAFLGDGCFPLSPPSPIFSSPASCAPPLHLPVELFSLRGIWAGRFSRGRGVGLGSRTPAGVVHFGCPPGP